MKSSELINLLSRFPWNAEISVEITSPDAAQMAFHEEFYHAQIQRVSPIGCNLNDIKIELVAVK